MQIDEQMNYHGSNKLNIIEQNEAIDEEHYAIIFSCQTA